jgi:hypothetical protein
MWCNELESWPTAHSFIKFSQFSLFSQLFSQPPDAAVSAMSQQSVI